MRSRPCCRAARDQHGQALTEFIVVMVFVLLPLLILIPVLAQLIALRQDTETAARYAVWERTSWFEGSDGETTRSITTIARHTEQRVYAAADEGVFTSQDADPVALDPFYKANWIAPNRAGLQGTLIAPDDAQAERFLTVTSREDEPPGMAGAMSDTVKLFTAYSPRMDLNDKGLYTSTLAFDLIDLSWLGTPFDQLGTLTYQRSNTLFTDPWNAGGPVHAKSRISGMVPMSFLDRSFVKYAQDYGSQAGVSKELASDSLIFGHADVDPMPAHRLSRY